MKSSNWSYALLKIFCSREPCTCNPKEPSQLQEQTCKWMQIVFLWYIRAQLKFIWWTQFYSAARSGTLPDIAPISQQCENPRKDFPLCVHDINMGKILIEFQNIWIYVETVVCPSNPGVTLRRLFMQVHMHFLESILAFFSELLRKKIMHSANLLCSTNTYYLFVSEDL